MKLEFGPRCGSLDRVCQRCPGTEMLEGNWVEVGICVSARLSRALPRFLSMFLIFQAPSTSSQND